ncbi:MAG: hypothetical protein F3739_09480, partial [Nitrospinae bacterium]|nr:hypothetical protein [Nitrospinota bacterium]
MEDETAKEDFEALEDLDDIDDELYDVETGADSAKQAINEIPSSKTVTVTTKYQQTGNPPPVGSTRAGGNTYYQRAQHRAVQFRESQLVGVH